MSNWVYRCGAEAKRCDSTLVFRADRMAKAISVCEKDVSLKDLDGLKACMIRKLPALVLELLPQLHVFPPKEVESHERDCCDTLS
jgi:hypothetical protein